MARKQKAKDAEFVRAEGRNIKIKLSDVIKIISMISEKGQSKKLEKLTDRAEHVVIVPSVAVNVVKEFIANHPELSKHPIGKKVLRPAKKMTLPSPTDPSADGQELLDVAPTGMKEVQATAQKTASSNDRDCCVFGPGG